MLFTLGNPEFDPELLLKVTMSKLLIPELFSEERNIFSLQRKMLNDNESIFVVFQTTSKLKDDSVLIGSAYSDMFVTTKILNAALSCWISDSFEGNFYLYSALSESNDPELASYASNLHSQLEVGQKYKGQVYYAGGTNSDRLPCIGADAWLLAST